MPATSQTPWRVAALRRRTFGPMTAELAERVLAQARGRQVTAIDRVRKLMTKPGR